MEPNPQQPSTAMRGVVAFLLFSMGLGGLLMSLCGGFFTTVSVMELAGGKMSSETRAYSQMFMVLGGGSLVFGLTLFILAIALWRRRSR